MQPSSVSYLTAVHHLLWGYSTSSGELLSVVMFFSTSIAAEITFGKSGTN